MSSRSPSSATARCGAFRRRRLPAPPWRPRLHKSSTRAIFSTGAADSSGSPSPAPRMVAPPRSAPHSMRAAATRRGSGARRRGGGRCGCSSRSRQGSPRSPAASRRASTPSACSIAAGCIRTFDLMQTHFSLAQLADPDTREADKILRTCVHCGFCTATCPTYVLLGDELDSPRGRIYLMKDMLENNRPASAQVAKHIDRCLSCLSCMTTCPSGVNYMHLVDQARHRIETTFKRPLAERWLRGWLALVLPPPWLFRPALLAAWPTRPLARVLPGRLGTLAALAPKRLPSPSTVDRPQA